MNWSALFVVMALCVVLLACLCAYVEYKFGFAWACACCFVGTAGWFALLLKVMP